MGTVRKFGKTLFKFEVGTDVFEIYGYFPELKNDKDLFYPEIQLVSKNGKCFSDFGEAWSGRTLNERDAFVSALISYISQLLPLKS